MKINNNYKKNKTKKYFNRCVEGTQKIKHDFEENKADK
jgi:hypothetical protein